MGCTTSRTSPVVQVQPNGRARHDQNRDNTSVLNELKEMRRLADEEKLSPMLGIRSEAEGGSDLYLKNCGEELPAQFTAEDLEAVTKIQAVFRGHRTREELKTNQNQNQNKMATEEVDIDLTDPEVQNAAAKIQAGFRGHKVRKDVKKKDQDHELSEEMKKKLNTDKKPAEEEEEMPDLKDPEVQKAATLIQAQFRGHLVRKPVKKSDDTS